MASQSDDYESVVKVKREEAVAEFRDDHKGFVKKVQHALHVTPSLVPLDRKSTRLNSSHPV